MYTQDRPHQPILPSNALIFLIMNNAASLPRECHKSDGGLRCLVDSVIIFGLAVRLIPNLRLVQLMSRVCCTQSWWGLKFLWLTVLLTSVCYVSLQMLHRPNQEKGRNQTGNVINRISRFSVRGNPQGNKYNLDQFQTAARHAKTFLNSWCCSHDWWTRHVKLYLVHNRMNNERLVKLIRPGLMDPSS